MMKQRIKAVIFAGLSLTASAFHSVTPVPRIALKDFDKHSSYQDRPLIIETGLDVESLCDNLMDGVSDTIITLQQTKRTYKKPKGNNKKGYQPKNKKKQRRAEKQEKKKQIAEKETKLCDLPMDQAIDLVMHQSSHDNSLFSFCEGLLDDLDTAAIEYTGKLSLSDDLVDWFDLFPPHMQPSDCVILAGEGASSTLHRDPFEWTGTSLCLEGTKIWRFLEPKDIDNGGDESAPELGVQSIDKLLKSYRLPSTAWEDGETCLSAGWQSNFNLYEHRHPSIPSARELDMDYQGLDDIAQNWSLLKPSFDSSQCSCWTVVQKPGDLLLIPAHWWHQTYALEPSLAVASQRCFSKLDSSRVIEHILSTTDTIDEAPDVLLQGDYSDCQETEEIQGVIDTLFDHLASTLLV